MALVNYSFVQGIVAGGTASYVQDLVKQEAVQKKSDTWITIALQANHLLLLAAETVRYAGLPLGSFGLLVQTAYVLTPLSFAAVGLTNKEVAPLSPERADQLNTVYRVGVVAASVATLALGNPVFAAASLSMLAFDAYAKGEASQVFAQIKKVTAFCALIGYGAQAFASQGVMAAMATCSTMIVGSKLCLLHLIQSNASNASLDEEEKKSESADEEGKKTESATDQSESMNHSKTLQNDKREVHYYYHKVPRFGHYRDQFTVYRQPPSQFKPIPSLKDSQSGNLFCRSSVWA